MGIQKRGFSDILPVGAPDPPRAVDRNGVTRDIADFENSNLLTMAGSRNRGAQSWRILFKTFFVCECDELAVKT